MSEPNVAAYVATTQAKIPHTPVAALDTLR
jgi:hypothetical protein